LELKAQITLDAGVFVNTTEFASTINIDGEFVPCVLEDQETPSGQDGTVSVESTLYAKTSSFDPLPLVHSRISIDGRMATVVGVDEEQDIIAIRLRWFDS
jgi:hypothetical protein